jgi:predicted nucleotidyltransferase/uncharacterized protein (UPF0332 family)
LVEISFEYKRRPVEYHFDEAAEELTKEFSTNLQKELGDLLKGVILFGSAVRGDNQKESDIDVFLLINDLDIVLSEEVITGLRVIIENTASKVSQKFHITSMHLSEFWEYVRQGDPIVVNILREGKAMYDSGFFKPVQSLLDDGRIRPSKEAVWVYYLRAPKTIKSAREHMLGAIVDLYWAVIDAAHALLMHIGVVPGAPHLVAGLVNDHFVQNKLLDKKYVQTIKQFYDLAKEVGHHKLYDLKGKKLDAYMVQADEFVHAVRKLLEQDPKELKK